MSDEIEARCACDDQPCTWARAPNGVNVECPGCAFAFDRFHANHDGTYSCPNCGHGEPPVARQVRS